MCSILAHALCPVRELALGLDGFSCSALLRAASHLPLTSLKVCAFVLCVCTLPFLFLLLFICLFICSFVRLWHSASAFPLVRFLCSSKSLCAHSPSTCC